MKNRKKVFLLTASIAVALGIIIAGLYFTASAETVWRTTRNAQLAILRALHNASLRFEIGNHYFGGGAYDIEKAESYFKKSLDIDPKIAGAHYQIARIYFIHGDFYTALDEINNEIELYPDFKRSYYVRGLIYGYANEPDNAIADFKTFLEWKPESWAGHNDLAWVYFMKGDYKNSAATAREGLVFSPNNVWLLNSLGVALLNEGKLIEAKKALTEALTFADAMTPNDWGMSYPGNNPSVYDDGLTAMKTSIRRNLDLIAAKSVGVDK